MNCKPGDLAIIIGAVLTPEMIGCVVECVHLTVPGEVLKCNALALPLRLDGPAWLVRGTGLIPNRSTSGRLEFLPERFVSDKYLRPVSGLPVTDDVTDEVTA